MHSERLIFFIFFTFKRFTHFQQPALFLCLFTRNHCGWTTRQLKREARDHCSVILKFWWRFLPSHLREGTFFGSKRGHPFDHLFSRYQCFLLLLLWWTQALFYIVSFHVCSFTVFLRILFSLLKEGKTKATQEAKSQKSQIREKTCGPIEALPKTSGKLFI